MAERNIRATSVEADVLTVEEAGRRLGIGRSLAYQLARCGKIPTIRLGRRLVVPRKRLERMLDGESPADEESAA
jgi:excisionase family DNA binding protein